MNNMYQSVSNWGIYFTIKCKRRRTKNQPNLRLMKVRQASSRFSSLTGLKPALSDKDGDVKILSIRLIYLIKYVHFMLFLRIVSFSCTLTAKYQTLLQEKVRLKLLRSLAGGYHSPSDTRSGVPLATLSAIS
jgi:hypothetical protein